MLVAIHLAPILAQRDDDEEDEDGHGIWPAPKKPCLLPSPWQGLPSDLLFHSVLVRLPFSVLLKLRSVSRSWRQSLSSHHFWVLWFQGKPNLSHQWSPNPNQNPNLILRNPSSNSVGHLNLLDSIISNFAANPNNCRVPCLLLCSAEIRASPGRQAAHWLRKHSIRYVQQKNAAPTCRVPQYWSRLHESFLQMQEPYVILMSDAGLLLLAMRREGSPLQLIVCNPLLRAHKEIRDTSLPPLTGISASAMGFFVDKECGEYRVIVSSAGYHIYNSSTGNWQMIPTVIFKDAASASPPIMDGAYFWLSHQKMYMNSSDESPLFVYHADVEVVTYVSTYFPPGVAYANCGRVWKDSNGLQTLAWTSTWFGIWKLDNGLWKREKVLPFGPHKFELSELDYVKVDNLLLLRFPKLNQVCIFDFSLDKGCWTPCCDDSEYLTGHCVFQPSCIEV